MFKNISFYDLRTRRTAGCRRLNEEEEIVKSINKLTRGTNETFYSTSRRPRIGRWKLRRLRTTLYHRVRDDGLSALMACTNRTYWCTRD